MTEDIKKILSEKKEEMVKVASANFVQQRDYKSAYLSLSDTSLPERMSELFKWCKYFYSFDPLIHGAINALATFPVTPILLEDSEEWSSRETDIENKEELKKESPLMDTVKHTLFRKIHIYKLLVEIGIDYFLYGNCIIMGTIKKSEDGEKEWDSIKRLPVNSIIIDQMPDGSNVYKLDPPNRIKTIVRTKSPASAYEQIPQIVRDAVLKNKVVSIKSEYIYHFKKPSDSYHESSWSLPGIANVLKLLMYKNILRQSQEAIAREHIVPLRIFFLNPQGGMQPGMLAGGFGGGHQQAANPNELLAREIEKTSVDPNYKIVSSIPVGMITAGGHGRGLLLAPEIDQIQSEILAGLNVPREFIFGGVSYSGSSVSLKILENNFIPYRLMLEDFINTFIIKNIAKKRGEWRDSSDDDKLVRAKLLDLKMQDDVQQKQMIINLNAAGKVSNSMLHKALGLDPAKVISELKEEITINSEMERLSMLAQVDTQTAMQKAAMVQQVEINLFQRKLDEYSKSNDIDSIDKMKVMDTIAAVEKKVNENIMAINIKQDEFVDEKVKESKLKYIETASIIVDEFKRDPDYGITMLEFFASKLNDNGLLMLSEVMNELLYLEPDYEIFVPLIDEMEKVFYNKTGTSIKEIQAENQPAQEEEMMEYQAPSDDSASVAEEESAPPTDEGIDMRPMPSQLPPRRNTLG